MSIRITPLDVRAHKSLWRRYEDRRFMRACAVAHGISETRLRRMKRHGWLLMDFYGTCQMTRPPLDSQMMRDLGLLSA